MAGLEWPPRVPPPPRCRAARGRNLKAIGHLPRLDTKGPLIGMRPNRDRRTTAGAGPAGRAGRTRSDRGAPAPSGSVRLLLFATVREAVGRSEVVRSVPARGTTIAELLAELQRDHPPVTALLRSCRFARNGRYVRATTAKLRPGDDLAIHPPFSGG